MSSSASTTPDYYLRSGGPDVFGQLMDVITDLFPDAERQTVAHNSIGSPASCGGAPAMSPPSSSLMQAALQQYPGATTPAAATRCIRVDIGSRNPRISRFAMVWCEARGPDADCTETPSQHATRHTPVNIRLEVTQMVSGSLLSVGAAADSHDEESTMSTDETVCLDATSTDLAQFVAASISMLLMCYYSSALVPSGIQSLSQSHVFSSLVLAKPGSAYIEAVLASPLARTCIHSGHRAGITIDPVDSSVMFYIGSLSYTLPLQRLSDDAVACQDDDDDDDIVEEDPTKLPFAPSSIIVHSDGRVDVKTSLFVYGCVLPSTNVIVPCPALQFGPFRIHEAGTIPPEQFAKLTRRHMIALFSAVTVNRLITSEMVSFPFLAPVPSLNTQ